MSHVNIIQGLFTLAVLGDGEWTQANALKPGSLWICPECRHVSVHCQCTALGCLWPTATKNPYQSVQFLLSSFHLWASQKRKVWHTHCSSSQHHNGSSFWLEDYLMLNPSNIHQGFQEAAGPQGGGGKCKCLKVLTHMQVCGTASLDWTGPQPGCRTDKLPPTHSSTWWLTSLPSAISSCRAGDFLAPSA